ncbi:tetratricopeptide repeat protein [Streptomyces sp. HPF1205]|uniref:ATP-binding protein n=1 Tax=Streptomyces sp. HPF1205 TaxID=2873262 RepID=UPI001CECB733|nr:tetratricopeptide repeat protein [Streptomyces sp. HPF1205]
MAGDERDTNNELSGKVEGPVVQARVVYGGIHIGSAPEPAGTGAPAGRVPSGRVPWQFPPSARITDRAAELAALERHRVRAAEEGNPVLAALSGLGGIGKTTLALAWLRSLRSHLPGGQLYADLGAHSPGGPEAPAAVVSRFLRALGVPPGEVPSAPAERVALYRSLTAGGRLAVLLDDAATAAQVRPLLPGTGNVTVVTSRRRMTGLTVDGCYPLHLEPLPPAAALQLLADTLADDRVATQPEDARALVELCSGLPLAVRVAGARLAARPRRVIATMVRSLAEERGRLEALAVDDDHDVRAALDVSYQGLRPGAARLYRLLGLHPGTDFEAPAAEAALAGAGDAAELLDTLHDASLLADIGDERYRFHDLVRLHAGEKAAQDEPEHERAAAFRRIADHYLATATRAEEILDPQHRTMAREYGPGPVPVAEFGDSAEAALDWLERELPNAIAVIRACRTSGLPMLSWQLADALWPLFPRRKFYEDWRTAHAEGLAAARELGDTAAEARMLTSGGMGELGSGDHERALAMFADAARIFAAAGDALGRARTLNYRGLAHQRLGDADRAAGFFRRAAEELPACGDERAGALARLNLAEVALGTGKPEEADADARTAHTVLLRSGDSYNAARAAIVLGRALLALDRPDQAEPAFSGALATLRRLSAGYEAARALEGLGEVAERRGRGDLARVHYQEAMSRYSAAGRPRPAAGVRARLDGLGGDGSAGPAAG